jgi:Proteobacterial transcriptional regulator-like domain
MPRTEWRLPAAYEHLRSLDAPGFAWEFLSRNPAFERDCKRLEHAGDQGPLSADELDDFARRWGVRFRKTRASRLLSPLDAREPAERDPDNPAATRSRESIPRT